VPKSLLILPAGMETLMSVRFTVFYPPHRVERAILARPAVRQGDFPCVAWRCGACRPAGKSLQK